MKDYEVLEAAAEYIEQHGWIKYRASNNDGNVCTLGALASVCGWERSMNYSAVPRLLDYQEAQGLLQNIIHSSIGEWNDEPKRTEQEVLDTLQKAAKLGRIREDINDSI